MGEHEVGAPAADGRSDVLLGDGLIGPPPLSFDPPVSVHGRCSGKREDRATADTESCGARQKPGAVGHAHGRTRLCVENRGDLVPWFVVAQRDENALDVRAGEQLVGQLRIYPPVAELEQRGDVRGDGGKRSRAFCLTSTEEDLRWGRRTPA